VRDVFTIRVILLTLIVLGMAVLLPGLLHLSPGKQRKRILYAVFAVYLFGNLYFTLLSRVGMPEAMYELELFSAYRHSLQFDFGILGTIRRLLTDGLPAGIGIESAESLEEVILNILLYVPMGYLMPVVWPRLRVAHVIIIGFLSSILTETIQLVFRLGLFEVDDLVNNTLGTIIGVILYLLLIRKAQRNQIIQS
jgi:glycopeptide antibiotics resistance protein